MTFFLKSKQEKALKSKIKSYTSNMPVLETQRLYLKKIDLEHAQDMYEYSKDPEVTKYLTWSVHASVFQTTNYIKTLENQYKAGTFFDWGLIEKQSGKFIGTCGFTSIDTANAKAEIGYVLSRDYWGRGLAAEAAKCVIDFGINNLGIKKYEARFIDGNVKSAAVMKKCGMKFDSIHYNSMYIKGEYKTIQVYSVEFE